MKLHEMHPAAGATHKKKRLGRGESSGHGKTSGRGNKGQKARTGSHSKRNFEGGQMPLARRLPKRGFTNIFRVEYQPVAVAKLERAAVQGVVSPDSLAASGVIRNLNQKIKILAGGALKAKLAVHAHAFSAAAAEAITAAGGSVHRIADKKAGGA